MSEQSTEQVEQQPQEGEQQSESFDKDYVEKIRREAAEYRTKLRAAEKAVEDQRKASMSEAEKAVAEAETRGRTAAAQEYGQRLARSEIKATAAAANADLDGVFDYLDVSRFVGDDGEPDAKAIAAFVKGLPVRQSAASSFDGGNRGASPLSGDMNLALRQAAGRA
jgi:membrane protein involved in colicin uptake